MSFVIGHSLARLRIVDAVAAVQILESNSQICESTLITNYMEKITLFCLPPCMLSVVLGTE